MNDVPNYLDLYDAGITTVSAAGVVLSDSAAQYFMTHARNAVQRLAAGDAPGDIDPAEPFKVLAREVVKVQVQRNSSQGLQGRKAGSDVIDAALKSICPLWPFCD